MRIPPNAHSQLTFGAQRKWQPPSKLYNALGLLAYATTLLPAIATVRTAVPAARPYIPPAIQNKWLLLGTGGLGSLVMLELLCYLYGTKRRSTRTSHELGHILANWQLRRQAPVDPSEPDYVAMSVDSVNMLGGSWAQGRPFSEQAFQQSNQLYAQVAKAQAEGTLYTDPLLREPRQALQQVCRDHAIICLAGAILEGYLNGRTAYLLDYRDEATFRQRLKDIAVLEKAPKAWKLGERGRFMRAEGQRLRREALALFEGLDPAAVRQVHRELVASGKTTWSQHELQVVFDRAFQATPVLV